MNLKEVIRSDNVNFTGIESSYFLLGLLSAFENRFQAMADSTMKEISWKQFFVIICINLCKKAPTVKELAEIMGSSHQNVKQILLKLEKKGFVNARNEPMIWADRKGWDCWNDRYGEESYGAVMCQNSDGNRPLRYR